MSRFYVCHRMPAGVLSLLALGMVVVVASAGCAPVRYSTRTDNYLKAKDLFQRGQYEEAAKYYRSYIEENPDSRLHEVIIFRLGQCYRHMNDLAEARSAFQTVIDRYQSGFWVERAEEELSDLQ